VKVRIRMRSGRGEGEGEGEGEFLSSLIEKRANASLPQPTAIKAKLEASMYFCVRAC